MSRWYDLGLEGAATPDGRRCAGHGEPLHGLDAFRGHHHLHSRNPGRPPVRPSPTLEAHLLPPLSILWNSEPIMLYVVEPLYDDRGLLLCGVGGGEDHLRDLAGALLQQQLTFPWLFHTLLGSSWSSFCPLHKIRQF